MHPPASQNGDPSNARRSHAVFLLIFAFLWFWKIRASVNPFNLGIDGSFYTDLALHVRDGHGLVTDVSLYHKGFSSFPHKSSVYPIWPLLYGLLARVFHWRTVAIWVPTIGYFATLLFAYLWGRALSTRDFFPGVFRGLGLGHVVVLIWGLHTEFFEFTTRPYTEGLACAFLMIGLWRSVPILRAATLRGGLELGFWMTMAFMTRSQLFLMPIAFAGAMFWMLIVSPNRRSVLMCFLGALAVFLTGVGLHYWYCADAFADWSFLALKFHHVRESDLLAPVQMMIPFDSWQETLWDRLQGFEVAFSLQGKYAYARSFHLFQYALLAVIPWLLRDAFCWCTDPAVRKRVAAWLRSPEAFAWIFALLLALGGFFSIYLFHKQFFADWNFARRQGVLSGLLFALAFFRLCMGTGVVRKTIAIALLIVASYVGVMEGIRPMVLNLEGPYKRREVPYTELAEWLQVKADNQGPIVVALMAHLPQELAPYTEGVGYHWFYELTSAEDVLRLFRELGSDFLIVPKKSDDWEYRRVPGGFDAQFKRIRSIGWFEVFEYTGS